MSCEEFFLEQLRERGFRLTPQRQMVLSVMHAMDQFATVEEIHQRVQAISSAVDVSTVYRTLDLLCDFNLVAMVELEDEQRRYRLEGVHQPHLHLVCRACGKVLGAELAPARPLADHAREQLGFELDLDHLSLPGLCRACAAAGRR